MSVRTQKALLGSWALGSSEEEHRAKHRHPLQLPGTGGHSGWRAALGFREPGLGRQGPHTCH